MKVVYIVHSTAMSGAAISFFNMISSLKNKGVEPIIFCPDRDERFIHLLEEQDIQYFIIPIVMSVYPCLTSLKSLVKYPFRLLRLFFEKKRSYKAMYSLIKQLNPDIIHSNVGVIHEGYQVASKLDIPHVWHIREYQTTDFNWKIFPSYNCFCRMLEKSYVIFITEDLKSYFSRSVSKNNNYYVIYNGILHSSDIHYNAKEKYFLCASRIEETKGHTDVVIAFSEFHKSYPDYLLYILGFGDPEYICFLKDKAKQLGCYDSIIFKGYQDNKVVIDYMSQAKALIVASKNEGFGRMTAESCFSGCLVIGRNTGGTKEILTNTGGFTFADTGGLTQQMVKVSNLTEPEYKSLALKAQHIAVRDYSIEQNVDSIFTLYKNIQLIHE